MPSHLILCLLVVSTLSPSSASNSSSEEDFSADYQSSTLRPTPKVNPKGFVNCEHLESQFNADRSLFYLGGILHKCVYHGVTLDEIESGLKSVAVRDEIGTIEYSDLYVPCAAVFNKNTSKLTGRLIMDYLDCQSAKALKFEAMGYIERRFAEIIEVFTMGNQSLTIDESTLVSCVNVTRRVALLCRDHGVAEDQWSRGFLPYHYADRWVVEEDLADLAVTCDEIFERRLEHEAYDDPAEVFVRCLSTMGLTKETRDAFEKKYAERLKEVRESDDGPSVDLRRYVSCQSLQPIKLRNGLVSVSWYAYERCEKIGRSYAELRAGVEATAEDELQQTSTETTPAPGARDLSELYVDCETVFNDELYSFNTALARDYEACKAAGRVDAKTRQIIFKKFEKMFKLFGMKRRGLPNNGDLSSHLVQCVNFPDKLAELCRRRGSTLAQELRGIGSLARLLGDRWLNTEPLDRLYVRCDEVFDDYKKYMRAVPIEQFMHCRFEEVSDEAKRFIDRRIAKIYVDRNKRNETRHSDIEISSAILFDQE